MLEAAGCRVVRLSADDPETVAREAADAEALLIGYGRVDADLAVLEMDEGHGARIAPRPLQQPHPRFYLGGGSPEAWEISARHADVHLFWGDTPETIAARLEVYARVPPAAQSVAAREGLC